jgi:hypothetical protein
VQMLGTMRPASFKAMGVSRKQSRCGFGRGLASDTSDCEHMLDGEGRLIGCIATHAHRSPVSPVADR